MTDTLFWYCYYVFSSFILFITYTEQHIGGMNDKQANNIYIDLHLYRSNKLVDDNFVFIKRDENYTELVDDFHGLVNKYSNCFYRNENSAVDLCDGSMVRNLFFHFFSSLIKSHCLHSIQF